MTFLGVTILQGVEFPIFLLIFAWALQQCSATALPVINSVIKLRRHSSIMEDNRSKETEVSVELYEELEEVA